MSRDTEILYLAVKEPTPPSFSFKEENAMMLGGSRVRFIETDDDYGLRVSRGGTLEIFIVCFTIAIVALMVAWGNLAVLVLDWWGAWTVVIVWSIFGLGVFGAFASVAFLALKGDLGNYVVFISPERRVVERIGRDVLLRQKKRSIDFAEILGIQLRRNDDEVPTFECCLVYGTQENPERLSISKNWSLQLGRGIAELVYGVIVNGVAEKSDIHALRESVYSLNQGWFGR